VRYAHKELASCVRRFKMMCLLRLSNSYAGTGSVPQASGRAAEGTATDDRAHAAAS